MRTRTASWFETKIKYQKCMEDGSEKVVTESYIVEALPLVQRQKHLSSRMMALYSHGETKVPSTKKANFNEIFFSDKDDDDKWFSAKLQFITIDEKTDKEKRCNVNYLVQAKSLARALRYIDEVMGKTMIDYDVVGLNETKLMDVFEYKSASSPENKENQNE